MAFCFPTKEVAAGWHWWTQPSRATCYADVFIFCCRRLDLFTSKALQPWKPFLSSHLQISRQCATLLHFPQETHCLTFPDLPKFSVDLFVYGAFPPGTYPLNLFYLSFFHLCNRYPQLSVFKKAHPDLPRKPSKDDSKLCKTISSLEPPAQRPRIMTQRYSVALGVGAGAAAALLSPRCDFRSTLEVGICQSWPIPGGFSKAGPGGFVEPKIAGWTGKMMIDSDRSLDFRNYHLFRSFQRNLDLISQCGATDYKLVYNPHRPITVTSSIYHKPKSCSS